jgi:hypothetical protein
MYVGLEHFTLSHILIYRLSGFAVTSADERLLITSNLKDAVDTYSIPPSQHIRSLCHPVHRNVPLTVCSALDGALTLVESDDGSPCVFDQRVGTLAQSLPHGNGEPPLLSSIMMSANPTCSGQFGTSSHCTPVLCFPCYLMPNICQAHSTDRHCVLVTGSSDVDTTIKIKIWVEEPVCLIYCFGAFNLLILVQTEQQREVSPAAPVPYNRPIWRSSLIQFFLTIIINLIIFQGWQTYDNLQAMYAFVFAQGQ